MARITYRGYSINLRFIKSNDIWQLELEKGNYIKTLAVARGKTIFSIEQLALEEIDKLTEEEIKQP